MAKIIKNERLKDYLVHLHITPGLIEDYSSLVQQIAKRSEYSSSKNFFPIKFPILGSDRLPMTVVIIRLKLFNLQEEDVDLRNLKRDISSAVKGFKPLIHIFDLDSKAPDSAVTKLIMKIFNLILQDIQLYLDSNIYDL